MFRALQSSSTMHQFPRLSMEALAELRGKTEDLKTSLMAITVLVDASVAAYDEWLSVVTDYVGPQLNYISGKFLDHQVRICRFPSKLYLLMCS